MISHSRLQLLGEPGRPTPPPAGGDMLGKVWRRRWPMLGVLLGCLAMGGVYALFAPRYYRVEARLLIQQQNTSADPGRETPITPELLATQAEVVRSTAVIERVARALNLTPAVDRPWTGPAGEILKATTVTPVAGANVLVVTYDGPDESTAIQTGRLILAKYEEYLKEKAVGAQVQVLRAVSQQELELRRELDRLGQLYAELRKTNPMPGESPNAVHLERQRLNQLADALTNAQLRRTDLESRQQSAAQSDNPMNILSQSGSPGRGRGSVAGASTAPGLTAEFTMIQDQLMKNQTQEQQLLRQYLPEHPDVAAVRRSTELLRKQLDDLNTRARRLIDDELVAAKAQVTQLESLYRAEYEKAKALDTYQVRERKLMADMGRVERLYEAVVGKVENAKQADQSAGSGQPRLAVSVLKQPDTAVATMFPPLALLMTLCGLLGLAGGLGLVVLLDRASPAPQSRELVPGRSGVVGEANGEGAPAVVVTILDR